MKLGGPSFCCAFLFKCCSISSAICSSQTLTTCGCIKFSSSALGRWHNITSNGGSCDCAIYADSTTAGSYIENTRVAASSWPFWSRLWPVYSSASPHCLAAFVSDTETGGFSLRRKKLKRQKEDCLRNRAHLRAHWMTNSCQETSSGARSSHMNHCGFLSWLSGDPVRVRHPPVPEHSGGRFQVSSPMLWMDCGGKLQYLDR